MKLFYFFMGVIVLGMLSCKTSNPATTQTEIENLNTIVQSQKFRIESDWANPQVTNAVQQVLNSGLLPPGNSAGAVNLIGNYNFLTISADSISSYLPYFGERQMNVSYGGGDSAIELTGVVKNYSAQKNKKNGYNITFEAKSKSESFNVQIELFPNLNSNIILNGSSRFTISYSGRIIKPE
jgi:hypothetical protein